MPRVSLIARNYAKALLTTAKKHGSIDKIHQELNNFKNSFSLEFARELKNPVIAKSDSIKIIQEIAKKLELGKLTSDFLAAVTQNKRLNLFPEIYEEFNHLARLEKNILDIEIISIEKLDQASLDKLRETISKSNPNKLIEFHQTIKKEILGGLQIKIGSNLIDASLKNQLATISEELIKAAK